MSLKSSAVRWGLVPMPGEANVSVPGFAFASAMRSFVVFAGTDGFTVRICDASTSSAIGVKSRAASYGSFWIMLGLIVREGWMMSSV